VASGGNPGAGGEHRQRRDEHHRHHHARRRRKRQLVGSLRTLWLPHDAAWIAPCREDPDFLTASRWFDDQRYWQGRILELREQVALMDEAPLVVD
jgi:hypothetical protein